MNPQDLMAGAQPTDAGSQGMATPEQMQELKGMMDELQTKKSQYNATQFMSKNKEESDRQDALMEVFQIMQKYGIDPSDPQAIQAFVTQLEQTNPELYQIFVQAFNYLLGQEGGDMGALSSVMPPTDIAQASPTAMPAGIQGMMPGGPQGPISLMAQTAGPTAQFPNLAK